MTPTTHTIDPNGDTLLIIQNANAPLAALSSDATAETQQNEPDSASTGKSQEADSKPEVRMRLSSKHLSLASTYFQKLGASNWKETTPEDGYSYTINTEEWDEEAILTLMNMIHGRTSRVPRSVTLSMLTKISILVDYYQCHEAVEFFANTWIDGLAAPATISNGRDLILRLCVAWIFSDSGRFQSLTRTIIYESKDVIDPLELPIPQRIIDALNKKREDLISGLLSGLHILKTMLSEDEGHCTFECSSVSLGALIKGMSKIHILEPRLERPFLGYSLSMLEKAIREIKEPSWYESCPGGFLSLATSGGPQSISTEHLKTPFSGFGFPSGSTTATSWGQQKSSKKTGNASGAVKLTRSGICSVSAKTKPILDEQLGKLKGLNLSYFRKPDKENVK